VTTAGAAGPDGARRVWPPPGPLCTWVQGCHRPAEHQVWKEMRMGSFSFELTCGEHHKSAVVRWNYRTDDPPIPWPEDRRLAS
jgi:hypothetical protein